MSSTPHRAFFGSLILALILLIGCSVGDMAASVAGKLRSSPTAVAQVLPTDTATPSATIVPTRERVLAATATEQVTVLPSATSKTSKEASATPAGTPVNTATPTPTPAPFGFYLNQYRPKCGDGGPRAKVKVVDEAGKPLADVKLELRDGAGTPIATQTTGDDGQSTFPIGDAAAKAWSVRISDASGGGVPARNPEVARPGLSCDTKQQSLDVEFQKGMKKTSDWPERQPISATYPPLPKATGPWSPKQVRPLSDWPRPLHDNGMGIHFLPIGYYADWVVDLLIGRMKQMHMTWAVVLYEDDNSLRIAAQKFHDAGIMVVWRPNIRPDASYIYMKRDMDILREIGMPPYIQLFNEPEVAQEWAEGDGQIKIKHFSDNWIKFADDVYAAGGFPGLQLVDPETLKFLIDRIKSKGKEYLFNQMFFVPHPYGSNHPPDYPYDANMQAREPGKTVDQDWYGTLGFLPYARIYQEKLGFVPPFIIGEGGWAVTVREDDKYPVVNDERHRDYHLEVYSWFKNGSLSDGEALPDYLFAFCPWIIASGGQDVFEAASWYQQDDDKSKKMTIKAMNRMPPFERKFSWGKAP
jgi:hypothetical protein